MERAMSELVVKNLAAVGVIAFGAASGLMVLAALFMVIGMLAGEWALLHVLAMLGMTGGFGVLAALCAALVEGYGGKVFADEKGEQDHE